MKLNLRSWTKKLSRYQTLVSMLKVDERMADNVSPTDKDVGHVAPEGGSDVAELV